VNGFLKTKASAGVAARARGLRRGLLVALLATLSACGGGSLWPGGGGGSLDARSAPASVPARAPDPLADFAARAQLGQEEYVGNPQVPARVTRAYNSGGGRPCRELLLGGLTAGRQLIYCEEAPGQWVAVRPLLRNGVPPTNAAFP
jgi:hypothetical protein